MIYNIGTRAGEGIEASKMTRGEILVVDYENEIPRSLSNLNTNGFRVTVVSGNSEAGGLAPDADVIILLANERRRECVKLMEHVRMSHDPSINFILVLGGGEDPVFQERVDPITFQHFKKFRFGIKELIKSVHNAIEMRTLKVKEKKVLKDLNRIEEELVKVENRLFTMTRLKGLVSDQAPRLN